MEGFAQFDALGLAELVRKREVTPVELVDDAIARVERLNPSLNAVVTPLFERAREKAKGPLPEGPFTGVPFLVKDMMAAIAGTRMTFGSKYARDVISGEDAELTRRHDRAGLVTLGRTNVPEMGILPTTESHFLGACKNPWDPTRTTGGSSGGSAAAVAARIVPMAHGNDGGGSIREPASCCGVFGLKPTRARNPMGPTLGDSLGGLVAEHALTRSVRDSAALLDATAGPDVGDPYVAPPPARPFLKEVGAPPGKLRVAFSTQALNGAPVHPDCLAAVTATVKLLGELGHECVEAAPKIHAGRLQQSFIAVWASGGGAIIEGLAFLTKRQPAPDELEPLTAALWAMGKQVPAPMYLLAVTYLQMVSRQVARFMLDYDVIVTPTLAEPPLPLGSFEAKPNDPLAGLWRAAQFTPFTPICNVTGQPAMSIPLHWTDGGLPIGTQIIGRFGDEATLFRLAAQLEEARPWAHRMPPIH